jgi:hypothetical protein
MMCAVLAVYFFPHIVMTPVLEGETGGTFNTGNVSAPMGRVGGYFVATIFERNPAELIVTIYQSDGSVRGCVNLGLTKPDIEGHYIDPNDCMR